MANSLASLEALSEGRLTIVAGVGWSKAEFDALGYDFTDRGRRTDEIIDLLRTCWRDDPASFSGEHYSFADIRVLPQPERLIPIWVGGGSEAAYTRGVRRGEGFQLIGVTPDAARAPIERLRLDRPEADFTISLRTGWDPLGMEPDVIRRELDDFADAGVQHVVAAPWRNNIDEWLRAMEQLAEIVAEA